MGMCVYTCPSFLFNAIWQLLAASRLSVERASVEQEDIHEDNCHMIHAVITGSSGSLGIGLQMIKTSEEGIESVRALMYPPGFRKSQQRQRLLAEQVARILIASGAKSTCPAFAGERLYVKMPPDDVVMNALKQQDYEIELSSSEEVCQDVSDDYHGTAKKQGITLSIYSGLALSPNGNSYTRYIGLGYEGSLYASVSHPKLRQRLWKEAEGTMLELGGISLL